jgi:ribosome biogenesis GTPase
LAEEQRDGLVVKAQSGFFAVQTQEGLVVSKPRGLLLKERLDTDPVAVGDRVTITVLEDGSGVIEEVAERERVLSRNAPSPGGRGGEVIDREQVILANPDQAIFVFACAEPEPNPRTLDRFLVIAEQAHVPAVIVANKIDLVKRKRARELFELYDALGYPVLYTSALKRRGLRKLRKRLTGKISALAGPSGVGKSSLLNVIQPELGLRVGDISEATTKGRHTTVAPKLIPLNGGGYVADTPGIRSVGLYDIEPDELDGYFVDIAPFVPDCQFNDCGHIDEPGCAVVAAVERGDIYFERYESFIRLRDEIEELYEF